MDIEVASFEKKFVLKYGYRLRQADDGSSKRMIGSGVSLIVCS